MIFDFFLICVSAKIVQHGQLLIRLQNIFCLCSVQHGNQLEADS